MISELSTSIRAHLYERVTNPFLGAVTGAWMFWNYELILVLFSSWSPDEKIKYIDTVLYSAWYISIAYIIVLPLLSALCFLFLYPIPARFVYRYTRIQLKELKKIKLDVENETPVSQDEHVNLKRKVSELEARYYTDLAEKDVEISRLHSMLKEESEGEERAVQPQLDRESSSVAPKRTTKKRASNTSQRLKENKAVQNLIEGDKIAKKKIVGITIAGSYYRHGKDINDVEPGGINVLRINRKFEFEEKISVRIELDSALDEGQVIWVFDGYSSYETESLDLELQKIDFRRANARFEVRQPNPIAPGKSLVVSNIVQFPF